MLNYLNFDVSFGSFNLAEIALKFSCVIVTKLVKLYLF